MYNVSISPHVRAKTTTQKVMLDVVIALALPLIWGVYHFGWNALLVIALSVASCVLSELCYELIAKKPITIFDCSAVVTGLILALNLPPNAIWWMPVLGGIFAIIPVKMFFGGIGQNFMNPALAGRCFLMISFTARMTDFSYADAVSSATPLAEMRAGNIPELLQLFIGNHGGTIGEVSSAAIIIGCIYLIARKVISPRIPVVYLVSTIAIIAIIKLIGHEEISAQYLIAQLLSGGLLAGAVFMATDYATSPITSKGQIIYAVILGLLTAIFRCLGSTAEGVSYAIIIGNLLVPLIEKKTIPRPFGAERTKGAKKNG